MLKRIKPKGKLNEADVIGAFSFGFRKYGPGRSNEVMAQIVEKLYKICEKKLPVISQWEITDAMWTSVLPIKSINKHREGDKYLDTIEVARQMVKEMKNHGWEKVIVVAHSLHAPRVAKVLQKLGVEVIIPACLETIPFDFRSEQWWTRNRFFWTIKEIPVRLLSFFKGWI